MREIRERWERLREGERKRANKRERRYRERDREK